MMPMRSRRVAASLFWGVTFAICVAPAVGQVSQEEVSNIFLPAPRGLRQQLSRARTALEEERYSDGVDLLGQLLASGELIADNFDDAGEQDYFLSGSDEGGTRQSLKSEAQRLLGEMPEKGRALYELKFGADARQLLDRALEQRDITRLVEVTRRYFHTDAGYEATMLIGRYFLDQGRPLAAALRFQRLEAYEYATRRYDPELSVLLATCWLLADMPDRARKTLAGLQTRSPDARLRIRNREVALFDPADRTLIEAMQKLDVPKAPEGLDRLMVWLEQMIGPETAGLAREATQWTVYRGDPARNAESAGGTPLLSPRWRVQAANHPTDEAMIREGRKQYLEQGIPVIPTLHPLAVNDVIIMRSPRRLYGVDFESGKRVWEFPWFDAPDEEVIEHDRIRPRQQAQNPHAIELNRRIWDDAPYGQLSSDGKQIFGLWGLASGTSQPSVLIQPFGVQRPNQAGSTTTNKLVALDLQSEGKLRWIVGDEDGTDEPRLAGAFFLGAPLPLMGQLYLLAEMNGEIRLVVLDAETGELDWHQQLAHVDTRTISTDPSRRAAGATPSFSDGVLVCPTSSGAVVAVDVSTRSLLWGYQYPMTGPRTRIGIASYRYNQKPLGERWADATVTIGDGRVVLTPVETDKLICLDLVTGDEVWKPIERADMLFTACIYHGNAIMVAKNDVRAISLEDGKTQWTRSLQAAMPSGRGMRTGDHYYLPTTDNRLLTLDLTDGSLVEQIETDTMLGNLVAYQDQVVSQNVDWLAAYYQTDPLRKIVDERLVANPQDSWALARKAELLLHDGDHGKALEVFQLAHKLNPEDDAIRASLVRSLLAALRDDFATNRRFADELESLISQPDEQASFCRWMAVGLKQTGDYQRATEYFLRLAAMETGDRFGSPVTSSSEEMVRIDGRLQIHRGRWLRVQIEQLLAEVDGEARDAVNRMVQQRLDEITQNESISKLSLFIEHFGNHPVAAEARMALAKLLLERGHLLQAEMELIELQRFAEPPVAATAAALLAEMLTDNDKPEEAAMCVQQLATRWSDVVTAGGQTGKEIADSYMSNPVVRAWIDGHSPWLDGKCETTRHDRRALASYSRMFPVDLDEVRGPFPRLHQIIYNQNQNALLLRDSYGKTQQQVLLGDQNRFVTTNTAAGRATLHGHLLVASVGFEVLAVDTLRGTSQQGDVVLWRNDLSSTLMTNTTRTRQLMPRPIPRKWGPARVVLTDTSRRLIGMVGPVTRLGVVFQKMQDLNCVDPFSGRTAWIRSGVDSGSDIFGDEQYTFVVSPESSDAMVLSTADGTQLGERPVTSRAERWITFGRNVLTCRTDGDELNVRCFDAWEQTDLWSRSFHDDTKCWRPGRDEVAFFQPDGKFCILKLATGEPVVECQFAPKPDITNLYVLPSEHSYAVIANGKPPSGSAVSRIYGSIGGDLCPEINGHIYSIDRQSGKPRWTEPAEVYGYCLPLDQARNTPALVFLQNMRVKVSPTSTRTTYKGAVLFLDRRDGRKLFAAEALDRMLNYSVEADPEDQKLTVKTNANEFVLTFSDAPIEGAKPYKMNLEESASTKTLKNVGKIAGAILDAITEKEAAKKETEQKIAAEKAAAEKEAADAEAKRAAQPAAQDAAKKAAAAKKQEKQD